MGCGPSAPDSGTDRSVGRELTAARREDDEIQKLLLLGAGGSGKSTFFKQLRTLHGGGHSAKARNQYRLQIVAQTIESMQTLVSFCRQVSRKVEAAERHESHRATAGAGTADGSDEEPVPGDDRPSVIDPPSGTPMTPRGTVLDPGDEDAQDGLLLDKLTLDETRDYRLSDDSKTMKMYETIMSYKSSIAVTWVSSALSDTDLRDALIYFWKDCEPVRALFANKRQFIGVPDSSKYFFKKVNELWRDDYLPDDIDILQCRFRTTGLIEDHFIINETRFLVCDVGGQRNERKKWIHFFDNVTAVLFVVSLSCYDEVPFEDVGLDDGDMDSEERGNNMLESIQVFTEVLSEPCFAETLMIVFFNKTDLMKEKIQSVPITTAFPEYDGPQLFKDSAKYIQKRFLKLNSKEKNPKRKIVCHFTCATDTKASEKLFTDVQQSVIDWSLEQAGLIAGPV
jgi:GTPase SAR1 family protein